MSETVERNGQTLYSPVLACRPVRPEDYPPKRLALYRRIQIEQGVELAIYPGSSFVPCEDCGIEIALGPRQEEVMLMARRMGLDPHVVCMLDGGKRVAEAKPDEVVLGSAGNPFVKKR